VENAQQVFEKICETFGEIGFEPDVVEKGRIGCVRLRGDAIPLDLYFRVRARMSLMELMIHVPLTVSEESRAKVAELIVRANCAWPLGRLDLKMENGLVVWHGSMPIEDGTITTRQIEHLLSAGVGMVHRYFRAINRLIYADDLSPAEAAAEVEMAEPRGNKCESR